MVVIQYCVHKQGITNNTEWNWWCIYVCKTDLHETKIIELSCLRWMSTISSFIPGVLIHFSWQAVDYSYNWCIHIEDWIKSNWACSDQLITPSLKTWHNRELRWECSFCGMNLALITNLLYTYLLFYICCWYIYEIKIHIKSFYHHNFETKFFADNQHNLGKFGRVKIQSHGCQWMGIVIFTDSSS